MSVEVPLFELGTVLFPHMPLALHVFEERYRAMLRDCEEQGIGFGVVAIREGVEVGGGAVAHDVGTLAHIRRIEKLDDGRSNLLVTGKSRFRVVRRVQRAYPAGEVEYLEDAPGDPRRMTRLGMIARPAFIRYGATLQELAGRAATSLDEVPDDPELLGYLIAATLQVEVVQRQRLLEAESTEDRLERCLLLLRREQALLERRLPRSGPHIAGISPN